MRVATMMHESPGGTLEFLGADCRQQDDQMECEFHHAMVLETGGECAIHTSGFKRVLRRIPGADGSAAAPFGVWESEPGPPNQVCGMRSVVTLRSTSVFTWWNAMIRWTAPAPNVMNETFCREHPREQEFKVAGKARLPCRTMAPVRH